METLGEVRGLEDGGSVQGGRKGSEPYNPDGFHCSIGKHVKSLHAANSSKAMVLSSKPSQPIPKVSEWVLDKIGEVSRVVGVSFEGWNRRPRTFLLN